MKVLGTVLRAIIGLPFGLALLFVAVVATFLLGCAPASTYEVAPGVVVSVLVVDNQRTEEETIYIEHDGVKGRRLGVVGALTSATFVLSESDVRATPELMFLAKAFANGWTDLSDPIIAAPATRYVWQLAPMRGNAFLSSQRSASADGVTVGHPYQRLALGGDRLPGNSR